MGKGLWEKQGLRDSRCSVSDLIGLGGLLDFQMGILSGHVEILWNSGLKINCRVIRVKDGIQNLERV